MIQRRDVEHFPHAPGVYLMKDDGEEILYVGKARDLKRRVSSYLRQGGDGRHHVRFLMERATSIDYLVTDTEKEALLLENTLIKRHRPRYNFSLKDDKTYFSLRIDPREEFPRITLVRRVQQDGARYFGPYSSSTAAREVLKELYRLFPLRHYPLARCRRAGRPCLYHQIGQCSAPCAGKITPEAYAVLVKGAIMLLEGKGDDIERYYRRMMAAASEGLRYEEAARWRDLLAALAVTTERQKVSAIGGDRDVVGFHREGERFVVVILHVRGGSLVGKRTFTLSWALSDGDGLESFLSQYYSSDVIIPPEILLPVELNEAEGLHLLLSERRGGGVRIVAPKRGDRRRLVEMAIQNAVIVAGESKDDERRREDLLAECARRLQLTSLPRRIECYDISVFQGGEGVGSRVLFRDGVPDRTGYRHYRIRGVSGTDDFAMLAEVFRRRFRADVTDPLPDLILVDGGIGQLHVLTGVLDSLDLRIAAASIAKSRVSSAPEESEIRRSPERIFLPGRKNPVTFPPSSPVILFLARIRDEAHRFAITYHRSLRGKRAHRSVLEGIEGVGASTIRCLLQRFGSVEGIRAASVEELCGVRGMGRKTAEKIRDKLNPPEGDPPPEG
ncbi:MAG: excinuclease ABC subunit UvrC [Desulfuromonadia bacterium]